MRPHALIIAQAGERPNKVRGERKGGGGGASGKCMSCWGAN